MQNSYEYVHNISYQFHQKFIRSSYELHTSSYQFHMNLTRILYEVHMKYKCTSHQIHPPNISHEFHMHFILTSHECSINFISNKNELHKKFVRIRLIFHWNFIRSSYEFHIGLHMNYPNTSCEFPFHYMGIMRKFTYNSHEVHMTILKWKKLFHMNDINRPSQ